VADQAPAPRKVPIQSPEYKRKVTIQTIGPIIAALGLNLDPEVLAAGVGVFLAVAELGYLLVRRRNAKKGAAQ